MPRSARLTAPGFAHHLISRFVNKAFRMTGSVERCAYLARVPRVLKHCDWSPFAYGLMSSHTHWGAVGGSRPSSSFIHPLHSGYANWLNRHQGTLGPVFAERHRSDVCSEHAVAALIAYIHNNPVRAGVAVDAASSTWTSHRAYLGLAEKPPWLDVERGLSMCGFSATPSGRLSFHEFVLSQSGQLAPFALSDEDREELRVRIREAVGVPVELSDLVLGDEQRLEVVAAPATRLRPRWPGPPEDALAAIAAELGVSLEELQSHDRRREVVGARRLALVLWSRHLGHPQSTMARLLGISAASACRLIRSVRGEAALRDDRAGSVAERLWRKSIRGIKR